jgi:hypothetical protein
MRWNGVVILSRSEGSRTMGNEILRSTLRMTRGCAPLQPPFGEPREIAERICWNQWQGEEEGWGRLRRPGGASRALWILVCPNSTLLHAD